MEEDLDSPEGRLRWARKGAGYESAQAFADKAGLGAVTYRSYENGQSGFAKHAARFGRLLGVTADWLIEGGPVPDGALKHLARKRDADMIASDLNVAMIRRVDISYAMGDGAIVADYPDLGMMPFDRNFLRELGARDTSSLFLCRGDGNSMEPTIFNQDLVMIDTSRSRVTMHDHIWALVVAGAGMIKRLRPLPDGNVMVLSDNPLVPEQTYSGEDVHVVGKVIWIGRMM